MDGPHGPRGRPGPTQEIPEPTFADQSIGATTGALHCKSMRCRNKAPRPEYRSKVNTSEGHVAGWSSLVARRAHNPEVVGSNPTPAMQDGKDGKDGKDGEGGG